MKSVNYLKKEDLENYLSTKCLLWKPNLKLFVIELKDKFIIVKRVGKCNWKKCKNACCKICSAGYIKDYSKGFFDGKDDFGKYIIRKSCNNLMKDGTCKLWKKRITNYDSSLNKGFPLACKNFPMPGDSIYWNVINVCSFKFQIIYESQKLNSKIINQEMIKCFRSQF